MQKLKELIIPAIALFVICLVSAFRFLLFEEVLFQFLYVFQMV